MTIVSLTCMFREMGRPPSSTHCPLLSRQSQYRSWLNSSSMASESRLLTIPRVRVSGWRHWQGCGRLSGCLLHPLPSRDCCITPFKTCSLCRLVGHRGWVYQSLCRLVGCCGWVWQSLCRLVGLRGWVWQSLCRLVGLRGWVWQSLCRLVGLRGWVWQSLCRLVGEYDSHSVDSWAFVGEYDSHSVDSWAFVGEYDSHSVDSWAFVGEYDSHSVDSWAFVGEYDSHSVNSWVSMTVTMSTRGPSWVSMTVTLSTRGPSWVSMTVTLLTRGPSWVSMTVTLSTRGPSWVSMTVQLKLPFVFHTLHCRLIHPMQSLISGKVMETLDDFNYCFKGIHVSKVKWPRYKFWCLKTFSTKHQSSFWSWEKEGRRNRDTPCHLPLLSVWSLPTEIKHLAKWNCKIFSFPTYSVFNQVNNMRCVVVCIILFQCNLATILFLSLSFSSYVRDSGIRVATWFRHSVDDLPPLSSNCLPNTKITSNVYELFS